MLHSTIRTGALTACLMFSAAAAAPLSAETLEELDAFIDETSEEGTGIAAARELAEQGEYLQAIAVLERVMAENPKSREAVLIHAIYLCRLDDKQGGLVELSKLKKKHYTQETLDEARRLCEQAGVQ